MFNSHGFLLKSRTFRRSPIADDAPGAAESFPQESFPKVRDTISAGSSGESAPSAYDGIVAFPSHPNALILM